MARRRNAPEPSPTAKALTEYVVQRRHVGDADGTPEGMWLDVGNASGHSGSHAIRKFVNGLPELAGGDYRAFPARSDSRLTVAIEVRPVPLFTVPKTEEESS